MPNAAAPLPAPGEPTPQALRGAGLRYFLATRPAFLSITVVAVLLGFASAWRELHALQLLPALLTLLFALVAHAGVNVVNDYHDARSGADAANAERLFPFTGGSRFIQNGVLSEGQIGRFGYALLVAVIPAGLWLAWTSGPGLILIGLAGLFVGWAYSAPPLRLMARGLGEFAVAGGWLLIVLGTDYVQRGAFAWAPFAVGLPYALLVAALLYVNQFPDYQGDRDGGKPTLVVRLGPEEAKWGYLLLVIVAYAWLVLQIGRDNLPRSCGLAVLPMMFSFHAARELLAHASQPRELLRAIRLTLVAVHLNGLLLAAGLLWNRA